MSDDWKQIDRIQGDLKQLSQKKLDLLKAHKKDSDPELESINSQYFTWLAVLKACGVVAAFIVFVQVKNVDRFKEK